MSENVYNTIFLDALIRFLQYIFFENVANLMEMY